VRSLTEGGTVTPTGLAPDDGQMALPAVSSLLPEQAPARPGGMDPATRRCSGRGRGADPDWGMVCGSSRPVGCSAPASTTAGLAWRSSRPAGRTTGTKSLATACGSSRLDSPRAGRVGSIPSCSPDRAALPEAQPCRTVRPRSPEWQPRLQAGSDFSWGPSPSASAEMVNLSRSRRSTARSVTTLSTRR
jgi:hypothetical protein